MCPDAIGMVRMLAMSILTTRRIGRSRVLVSYSLASLKLDNREQPSRISCLGRKKPLRMRPVLLL